MAAAASNRAAVESVAAVTAVGWMVVVWQLRGVKRNLYGEKCYYYYYFNYDI